MKQRFSRMISFFMCFTLMASVIAGALSVSVHFAHADAGDIMYLGDLEDELIALAPQHQSDIESFFAVCDVNLQSPSVWVSVIKKGSNYICTCWQITNQSYNNTLTGLTDTSGGQMFSGVLQRPYPNYSGFQDFYFSYICSLYFKYQDDIFYFRSNGGGSTYLTSNRTWPNSFGTSAENFAFPNYYDLNDPDTEVYCTKDISTFIQNYGFNFTANLFTGSSVPPEVEFEVLSFWLGERHYLTVKDQYLMYSMIDFDNEGGNLKDFRGHFWTDSEEYVTLVLYFEDTVLIPGGENFIVGLENVSPEGVYAWDITSNGLITLDYMYLYDYVDGSTEDIYRGYATNCPYDLTAEDPGSNGQPDSYTNFWSEFNEYVSNYNTTVIVPDQLSNSLFGVNGMELYPVSVAAPHQSLTTWKWWSNLDDLAINYELMDTVIIHSGSAGYTLVYFYGTEYPAAFIPVQNIELNELFDKFDCVIIVPDDQGELDKTSWWESVLDYLADELGLNFDFTVTNNFAVSGSASGGVEYVSGRPSNALVTLDGYCFVTPKGIQRQHLYAFSDGITKLYQLMADYCESEDSWKSSFLEFSSSLFYGINTLNGTLGNILTEIGSLRNDINRKLDTLINNTSQDIPDEEVWYTSLWNWILQFKPTNENFSNSLQVYDDNWNQIPQISAAPSIPLIPTLGG